MVIVRGTKAQSSLRHKLRKKSMNFRHFKFGIVAIAMVILTNWLPIDSRHAARCLQRDHQRHAGIPQGHLALHAVGY
jgi:hypothetical protein